MSRNRVTASAAAQVRRHACAFVRNLNRGGGRADIDLFLHEVVGHAVEAAVESDVRVDVRAGLRPMAKVEQLAR